MCFSSELLVNQQQFYDVLCIHGCPPTPIAIPKGIVVGHRGGYSSWNAVEVNCWGLSTPKFKQQLVAGNRVSNVALQIITVKS